MSLINKIKDCWESCVLHHKRLAQNYGTTEFLCLNGWALNPELGENKNYKQEQQIMKATWEKHFQKYGNMMDTIISREFVQLFYRPGIPDIYRGSLWLLSSGSIHKKEAMPYLYQELLEKKEQLQNLTMQEIEKDVNRSLPTNPFYQKPEAISSLRNVLRAISVKVPNVGYCQSMNILAATILLYTTEEECFWLLSHIIEDVVPEYYSKGLLLMGSVVDQKVFTHLAHHYFPKIVNHLKNIGFPLELVSLPWYLCFFIGYIPWEASLKVLDMVFCMGSIILFRVGLAILSICEEDLIRIEDGSEIVNIMEKKVTINLLFEVAMNKFISVNNKRIEKLRRQAMYGVMSNLQHTYDTRNLKSLVEVYPQINIKKMQEMMTTFRKAALKSGKTEENNTPVVGPNEFIEWIHCQLPHIAKQPDGGEDLLLTIFKLSGKEKKGFLNFEDLLPITSIMIYGSINQQIELCFKFQNVENTEIGVEELNLILHSLYILSYKGKLKFADNFGTIEKIIQLIFGDNLSEKIHSQVVKEILFENDNLEKIWSSLI